MTHKIIGAIIGIAIISTIGFYILNDRKSVDMPTSTNTNTNPTPASIAQDQPSQGQYINYDVNLVSQTPGTKILFFHAPWCPQCRQLEASIKNGAIPNRVTIFKVDYDSNQQLRQKYGVTLQTTLVKIDDQGKEIKKFVAYNDPSLDTLTKELLQ